MQAQLQGWDVAPGHGGCAGGQGPLRLTSKIGSEEKLGRGFGSVCPVSAPIRLPTWLPRPSDRDLSDTRRSATETAGSPELRQRPAVQLTGRLWHLPARFVRHARARVLKLSPTWPWTAAFLTCWQRLCALPAPT